MLSIATRRELVARYQAEYRGSGRKAKGEILDALCGATGWNRKYAIGALRRVFEFADGRDDFRVESARLLDQRPATLERQSHEHR